MNAIQPIVTRAGNLQERSLCAVLAFCLGLVSTACTGSEDTADSRSREEERQNPTMGGSWMVSWEPVPDPVPQHDLFSILVTVEDSDGELLSDAESVDVDCDMPSHGHGMTVEAEVTNHGDGTYTAEPLKLQMAGDWLLYISVTVGGSIETAEFHIPCCE
jgi:hypothetical protein